MVTAVALGVGTPVLAGRTVTTAATESADPGPSSFARAALAASQPTASLPSPAVPLGYHPSAAPTTTRPVTAAATSSRAGRSATGPSPTATASPARPTPAASSAGAALPLPVPTGTSTQVITVVAPSSRATTATLTAWEQGPGGWTAVLGPVSARIGAQGVGVASESTSRTPAGTFTLTEGFGRLADPGTELPYRTIGSDDYWVSDVASPLYNRFEECAPASCPFDAAAGERLWDAGSSYDYAVVIDYNRWPAVPGRGSAFFLHVTNGAPTAGCVAVPRSSLVTLMRWLRPSEHPLVSIGVG